MLLEAQFLALATCQRQQVQQVNSRGIFRLQSSAQNKHIRQKLTIFNTRPRSYKTPWKYLKTKYFNPHKGSNCPDGHISILREVSTGWNLANSAHNAAGQWRVIRTHNHRGLVILGLYFQGSAQPGAPFKKKQKKICHVTVGPTLMNELITGVAWLLSGCVFKCYSRSESAESSKRIPLLPPHVIMIYHTAAWTRTGKLDALCLGLFLIWNHVSVPKCHLVFEWNPAIYKVSRISFWCWSAVCRDVVQRCLVNINLFTWYCFVLSLFF